MSNLKPIDQTVATPYWEAISFILNATFLSDKRLQEGLVT